MKKGNKILSALVVSSLLTGYSAFAETDLTVKYDSDSETLPSITLKKETTIRNVADGLVGKDSTEAVNGNQLYAVKQDLSKIGDGMVENAVNISNLISYNTDQDNKISDVTTTANKALQLVNRGYNFTVNGKLAASFDPDNHYMNFQEGDNVTIEAYTTGSGILATNGLKFSVKADGKVEAGNTGLVTGGMVKEAINLATEGIATDVNVANKADKDLSNLSDGGKDVIANAAKAAASEAASIAATAAASDKANKDASNINVVDWSEALGTTIIQENGIGLITSGTLFTAINDMSSDVTEMLDEMSLQFAMDDASNIGTNLRKAKEDGGYEEATANEKQINLNNWGKAIGTGAVEESNGQLVTGGTVYTALSGYAKKDASNINVVDWQEALGTGANSAGDTGLITGDTLNKVLANYSGGMTYSGSDTIAISDGGVISVTANGKVESNNAGLVTGGQVSEAIKKATEGIATDVNIANKADKSYVDTELGKKADADNVYTKEETDKKVENAVAGVNTAIADKADKSYVDTELGKKADQSYIDAELAKKVDTTTFNEVKDQVDQNTTAIANKADKSYVDDELAKKADANNVYTKEEADKKFDSIKEGLAEDWDNKVNADGSNIDKEKWQEALGDGKDEAGNKGLINGDTLHNALNDLKKDGIGLVQQDGDTITVAKDSEATKVNFSGTDKDGNTVNRVLTGITTDENDATSAANVGYVNGVASDLESRMDSMESHLSNDIKEAGAVAAALAGLHHIDYDPDNKLDFAVATAGYRGKSAAALGAFYQPNENIMFSLGGTIGSTHNAWNMGVSFKLGHGGDSPVLSRRVLGNRVNALAAQNKELAARNEQLEQDVQDMKNKLNMLLQSATLAQDVQKSIVK